MPMPGHTRESTYCSLPDFAVRTWTLSPSRTRARLFHFGKFSVLMIPAMNQLCRHRRTSDESPTSRRDALELFPTVA